uniref:Uncharacterized protein n=1 Tax=Timema tahoe TaxID=61484 RepID=A0A7R9FI54_9NEOP|nr:unnamed protein product [Timema tahoe]
MYFNCSRHTGRAPVTTGRAPVTLAVLLSHWPCSCHTGRAPVTPAVLLSLRPCSCHTGRAPIYTLQCVQDKNLDPLDDKLGNKLWDTIDHFWTESRIVESLIFLRI